MSPELKAALEKARNRVMSPYEKFEQRVSFVYGQQDHDNPNPRSKDDIRQMLVESSGYPRDEAAHAIIEAQAAEIAALGEALDSLREAAQHLLDEVYDGDDHDGLCGVHDAGECNCSLFPAFVAIRAAVHKGTQPMTRPDTTALRAALSRELATTWTGTGLVPKAAGTLWLLKAALDALEAWEQWFERGRDQ